MVLKRESIITRLQKLEEILSRLREKEEISLEQYKRDVNLQWFVERGLELASSLIFDIGNHILAGAFRISVDEYEKILERLWQQKVISEKLYKDLRGLGGFRNILVHGYLELNHKLVYAHYRKALQVFPSFINEITTWLESYGEGGNTGAD
ncbi:MAG: DUF86 domain-containing protein [Candidatus Caldatribacterium sp.]|nr:DUF86 domain-containing protein [Candidatus Caldatribacterium sp.]